LKRQNVDKKNHKILKNFHLKVPYIVMIGSKSPLFAQKQPKTERKNYSKNSEKTLNEEQALPKNQVFSS
jgi:hypothetical protein